MKKIKILRIIDCDDSSFVKLQSVIYIQNGQEKRWDFIKTHNSVAALLYHEERDAFLLVKQFRPAVFLHSENDGFTYELCAGIIDKQISEINIIKEEIYEECGYSVPLNKIEKITSFYSGVGFTGSKQTLYFASINESMKKHSGGGIDDEMIELFFLPIKDANTFIFNESHPKTPIIGFAISWFFDRNKGTHEKI